MKTFLVSTATPSGLRKWNRVTAIDYERAANSAREAAKADAVLSKHLLRITVYQQDPTPELSGGPEWYAVFGLIDTGLKTHAGNL